MVGIKCMNDRAMGGGWRLRMQRMQWSTVLRVAVKESFSRKDFEAKACLSKFMIQVQMLPDCGGLEVRVLLE
jgi:hypothetical protein